MGSLNRDVLDKIVNEISKNEKIINPTVDYKYGGKNGDGYLGVINAFELNGENKNMCLIVKSAPTNLSVRGSGPIQESFITEVQFYEKIMPAYRKFQEKYGIKQPFDEVPRCYATNTKECEELLVLENIKMEGYDLWDRKKGMNKEHIEFVFNQYGKFHAISYAMRNKDPKLHEGLIGDLPGVFNLFLEKSTMTELFVEQAKNLLKMLDPINDKKIIEKLAPIAENIPSIFKEMLIPEDSSVIIHGDCWCNNMMFKYNENKLKPESMRLLDFQVVQFASPVQDLSYFYYVCALPEELDNIEYYLKIYHKSLSQRLIEFGCDPEKILPFSKLYKMWMEKSKFGLIMSIFLFKLMLTDKEEAVNLTEAAEKGGSVNPMDAFSYEMKDDIISEYKRRCKAVLEHFCKFNFF